MRKNGKSILRQALFSKNKTNTKPLSIQQYKILIRQIEKSLCKIKEGNGFLCHIPNPVLITTNFLENEKDFKTSSKINILFSKNTHKTILINLNRNVYVSNENGIIIIELFPEEDGLIMQEFLEIDNDLFNSDIQYYYKSKDIYIIQYTKEQERNHSTGEIKNFIYKNNYYEIEHTAEGGTIGGPILLYNNRVIGIQIESNKGILINSAINEYMNKLKLSKKNDINNNKNEIIVTVCVENYDINKKIYFLDGTEKKDYYDNGKKTTHFHDNLLELNPDNTKLYINYKEEPFKKYFVPQNEGTYKIKLIFNIFMTNCAYMFSDCHKITNIDLSLFKTQNVINMEKMFHNCYNLLNIDLSSFDTKNVINMEDMFSNCFKLSSIDLSSFNTGHLMNMKNMFNGCQNLANVDLTSFDTNLVIDMSYLFYKCEKIKKIDLLNFDARNVKNMEMMFYFCVNLSEVDLTYFNTANVTNMRYLFHGCQNLTKINLSYFNTKNVSNIKKMFYGCAKLINIDLTSFDIKNTRKNLCLFGGCPSLKKIKVKRNEYEKIKKNIPLKTEMIIIEI